MADEEQHQQQQQDQSNSIDNGGGGGGEQKNVKFSPSTEFATDDLSDDSQGPEEEVKTTTTTYAVAREGSPLSLLATIDEETQQRESLQKLNDDGCDDRPGVTFTASTQFCTEDCFHLQEDVEQFLTSEEENVVASAVDEEQPLLLSTSPSSCKDTTPSLPPLLSTIKEKANDVKNTIVAETIKKMPFKTRTPTPPPVVTPVVITQEKTNTNTIPVAITPGVNSTTTPAAVLVLPATETTPLMDHIGSSSKISGMDSIATSGTAFTAATEMQFYTPHNVTTTTPLTSSGQPPQPPHSNARRESMMSTMSALTYNEDDIEHRLSDFIKGDFDIEIPMNHDNHNNNNRTEQSTYNTINLYRNTTSTGAKRPARQSILANKRLSRHSRNILVSPRRTSSFTELGDMYETVPTQLTDNVKLVTNEQMYYEGSHKGQIYYAESSFFQNHQSPKYAVTISCDIYRQILQEMDDANSTACGLYFCCHGGDGAHTGVSSSDYVDIKLAWSLVLAIFAVLLVIDYTFPWPEDDHTSDDMFSAQLLPGRRSYFG